MRPPLADQAADDSDVMFDYLYLRDNPAGDFEELWYHTQGCRNWLRVQRNTRSHVVAGASFAHPAKSSFPEPNA